MAGQVERCILLMSSSAGKQNDGDHVILHILKGQSRIAGYLVVLLLLGLWEILSRLATEYQFFLPPVSAIAQTFAASLGTPRQLQNILISLMRFFLGYSLGILAGLILGVLMGSWRFAYALLKPLVELLRPLPAVALIPIALLFFGLDTRLNIAVIAWGAMWPVLINTVDAVHGVDPFLVQTGRVLGLGPWSIVRKIVVPSSLPFILSGLRVSLSIAWIFVVVTEMVVSDNGLGFFILDAERALEVKEMFAGLFTLTILGYLLNRLFLYTERRMLAWQVRLANLAALQR